MTKVLFVCMGNVCRSPIAEGVFRKMVRDAGIEDIVQIGFGGDTCVHVGNRPTCVANKRPASAGTS